MKIRNVGVIGSGTMGVGLTIDLVLHGFKIVLVDISGDVLEKGKGEIIKGVRFAPLLKEGVKLLEPEEVINQITFSKCIESVKDCDFIVENVPEDWNIKNTVYRQLDNICRTDICFGVNTSCTSITKVGAVTNRPDKVIGMHFMNPVILKSCIEVIKGYYTSEQTINTALEFLNQLEKEAIIVEDLPGFVSNRISHLFMNEAAFVVQDQVASPQKIDEIFKKCFGHKMGPLETADLIGIDTVVNSLDVLYESYQDSKYRCCPLLRKMVSAGLLGKKTCRGFYNYE